MGLTTILRISSGTLQNAKCKMQNAKYKIELTTILRMSSGTLQNTKHKMQNAKCKIQNRTHHNSKNIIRYVSARVAQRVRRGVREDHGRLAHQRFFLHSRGSLFCTTEIFWHTRDFFYLAHQRFFILHIRDFFAQQRLIVLQNRDFFYLAHQRFFCTAEIDCFAKQRFLYLAHQRFFLHTRD